MCRTKGREPAVSDLAPWEMGVIGLLFVWGGFVRSGLGFGGAVLTLPFLLMIRDQPLLFLPIISVHLLFFSGITVWQAHRAEVNSEQPEGSVNWPFLRYALPLMLAPKLIGVAGVITLPGSLVSGFIFATVCVYAFSYILGQPLRSGNARVDACLLMLGGYVSGVSLIAAPLVVPRCATRCSYSGLCWSPSSSPPLCSLASICCGRSIYGCCPARPWGICWACVFTAIPLKRIPRCSIAIWAPRCCWSVLPAWGECCSPSARRRQ